MPVDINIDLHESQGVVWESYQKYRYNVIVAGRRWGKTIFALRALLISALATPRGLFWYVAPYRVQAKDIAWNILKSTCRDLLPHNWQPDINESELSLTFKPNGACIKLKGADNPESLLGMALDAVVIDEFASINNAWQTWYAIIRPMLADKRGKALFIGTPRGKNAFYELFQNEFNGIEGWKSHRYFTIDNPYIQPDEVEEARKTLPDRYFRQEFEASFEDNTGLVWPEFSERHHVVEPFYLPAQYQRLGAVDTALKGTTASLKAAIDEKGRYIIYSEYYQQDVRVSDVCRAIRDESISQWYIDPASVSQKVQNGDVLYNLLDEYNNHGLRCIPANNDVDAGILRVAELFKAGKLIIFNTCKNLLYELERYHWLEDKQTALGDRRPQPFKSLDHAVDCLRYICLTNKKESELSAPPVTYGANSPMAYLKQKERERQEQYA